MIIDNTPFYKEMKDALAENRLDKNAQIEALGRVATLEKQLETERLTPDEIANIHKQISAIKERYVGRRLR